ncbi:hypothetical protein AMAG_12572 [Allomyces macrogynus ATCC 38327]|uniref:Adenylyl cyclase-associated protein n=1 Tax=Allomyces macrogynus (strain ATCC 38327) TaxID=578462 RepID=A0A0L0SZL6_ALLM3|nr:hypothetical protein AMAG_12572 [Allomyces macrogynus ATCC 38327]|eukprot:KNE67855.1 hypothetical protein AMAG_12572 [Allomyces macrogynus ATCC 38327]
MAAPNAGSPPELTDLIKRLEAATSKLEQFARSAAAAPPPVAAAAPAAVASRELPTADAAPEVPEDPRVVTAFDEEILQSDALAEFLEMSARLSGPVKDQADRIEAGLKATRTLILVASRAAKPASWPTSADSQLAIKTLRECIEQTVTIKEKTRSSPFFAHLSAIADGVPALGWVVVAPKPGPYINEMRDAAQFYLNRVAREYRDKDPHQIEWGKAFTATLNALNKYVMEWHTTGLTWNAEGVDLKTALDQVKAGSAAAGSSRGSRSPAGPPAPDMGSVFAQLNVGSAITAGLKKVDKSQMTHKNPELRAGGVVKSTEKAAPAAAPAAKKKPARMTHEGAKWIVEYYDGVHDLVIEDTNLKTVVYMYGCTNTTLQVKGKINSIAIDGCKKSGVVVDSVVSTVDVVNGKGLQLQIMGATPTIAVDNTDGLQLYLSKDSLAAEILTAKSSEINVLLPPAEDGGDYLERPVPEQFKTTIDAKSGTIVTVPVEHAA